MKVARAIKTEADTAKKLAQIMTTKFGDSAKFDKVLADISAMAPGPRDAYIKAAIQGASIEAAGKARRTSQSLRRHQCISNL